MVLRLHGHSGVVLGDILRSGGRLVDLRPLPPLVQVQVKILLMPSHPWLLCSRRDAAEQPPIVESRCLLVLILQEQGVVEEAGGCRQLGVDEGLVGLLRLLPGRSVGASFFLGGEVDAVKGVLLDGCEVATIIPDLVLQHLDNAGMHFSFNNLISAVI